LHPVFRDDDLVPRPREDLAIELEHHRIVVDREDLRHPAEIVVATN
jgi:hypothetical protein